MEFKGGGGGGDGEHQPFCLTNKRSVLITSLFASLFLKIKFLFEGIIYKTDIQKKFYSNICFILHG